MISLQPTFSGNSPTSQLLSIPLQGNGVYTSCCFLPGTTQAITVSSIGEVSRTLD